MTTPSIPGQTASTSSASGPQAQARAHRQAYRRRHTRAKAKSEALHHKEAAHVEALPVLHPHAAGIDIGSRSHWVCVGFTSEAPSCLIREFPAHTDGLKAIVAFLHEHQVTTIALESTGIYWVPLYELLQAEGAIWRPVSLGPAAAPCYWTATCITPVCTGCSRWTADPASVRSCAARLICPAPSGRPVSPTCG